MGMEDNDFGILWIWGFCGYGDSVGIPTGFSVGMGWVWGLKFNPHGSPAKSTSNRCCHVANDFTHFTVHIRQAVLAGLASPLHNAAAEAS